MLHVWHIANILQAVDLRFRFVTILYGSYGVILELYHKTVEICSSAIRKKNCQFQSLTKVLVTWWSFGPAQYKLLPVRIFFMPPA